MDDKSFDEPVSIMIGAPGKIRVVASTREAAECLINYRWPRGTGKKHRSARQACLDVFSGIKDAKTARKAFEAAAKESEILVGGTPHADNPVANFLSKGRPAK